MILPLSCISKSLISPSCLATEFSGLGSLVLDEILSCVVARMLGAKPASCLLPTLLSLVLSLPLSPLVPPCPSVLKLLYRSCFVYFCAASNYL